MLGCNESCSSRIGCIARAVIKGLCKSGYIIMIGGELIKIDWLWDTGLRLWDSFKRAEVSLIGPVPIDFMSFRRGLKIEVRDFN